MTTSPLQVHLVHHRCACGRLEGEHMAHRKTGALLGTDDGHCAGYTATSDVYRVTAYVDVPIGSDAPRIALQVQWYET